jgi:hypothetical protein
MSTTTTLAEPPNGSIAVISIRGGGVIPVIRDDGHDTAGSDAHWLDLTCPEDERVAETWAALEVDAAYQLGDPIDPATTQEPADGTRLVVKRVNADTEATTWYTVLRADCEVPDLETIREQSGSIPLDEVDDEQEREDQRADEERELNARWHLEQDSAEDEAGWGDAYGKFLWPELGTDSNEQITVTVYPYA